MARKYLPLLAGPAPMVRPSATCVKLLNCAKSHAHIRVMNGDS